MTDTEWLWTFVMSNEPHQCNDLRSSGESSNERPVRCHLCQQAMHYSDDARHVPELNVELHGNRGEAHSAFYVHLSCWNQRFGSDTPSKDQLATLGVINVLRTLIIALNCRPLATDHCEDLLNLLADAEAKLQLP